MGNIASLPRYDVVLVIGGLPQKATQFNAVDAAARFIAEHHRAGHIVKVLTNSLTETVRQQRLRGLVERVNNILTDEGFVGEPWQP